MTKTIAQVYLVIAFGDFDPQIVSDCLKLKPSRQYKKGDLIGRPTEPIGLEIEVGGISPRYRDHAGWSYEPDQGEETTDISIQTRKLMKIFEPRVNELLKLQRQLDARIGIRFYLQFYENMNPTFRLEKNFVSFAHKINTNLDIDMYYYCNNNNNNMDVELPDIWVERRTPTIRPTVQATLLISGNDFNPQSISNYLKLKPTEHYKKGDLIKEEASRYRSNSAWIFALDSEESYDAGEQAEKLAKIFRSKITELLTIQQKYNAKISVKLYAYIWDESEQPGIVLESDFLTFASAINADVDIGVYLH